MRAISVSLLTTAPRASISVISTSIRAAAQPEGLAVGEQFPAVRQQLETTEGQVHRWSGIGVHWAKCNAVNER